jgi:hypothetical protein
MTDSTLSLAARLAAHLIVDAIELAKPGARLAAKIGDRALSSIGRNPFNEAEAQRFLYEDALNKAEEQVDSLEPGWSSNGWLAATIGGVTCPSCLTYVERDEAGEFHCSGCGSRITVETSAPGSPPKPPVDAESPSVADPPSDATEGHPSVARISSIVRAAADGFSGEWQFTADEQDLLNVKPGDPFCGGVVGLPVDHETSAHSEQPAGAGDPQPGIGGLSGRAYHELYREIQEAADAAVVADVLDLHTPSGAEGHVQCWCGDQFHSFREQAQHVAPLIIAALQQ